MAGKKLLQVAICVLRQWTLEQIVTSYRLNKRYHNDNADGCEKRLTTNSGDSSFNFDRLPTRAAVSCLHRS